jgi:NADH-quinone oxidoreductase subunit J
LDTFLFYFFASAAIGSSIVVVVNKNPIGSILSLVLTLFTTSILYIMLSAHFIAIIQILVYAGAIMVLFMFTVMFLILREESLNFDAQNVPLKASIVLSIILITGIFIQTVVINTLPGTSIKNLTISENYGTVEAVGTAIFTDYILPFELTSVLILVAMIGVMVLSKGRTQ